MAHIIVDNGIMVMVDMFYNIIRIERPDTTSNIYWYNVNQKYMVEWYNVLHNPTVLWWIM